MIIRTEDYRIINRICGRMAPIDSNVIYLLAGEEGKEEGLFIYKPYKDGLILHAELKPELRGKRSKQEFKDSIEWIRNNTDCKTIYAEIKGNRKDVCVVANYWGLKYTHQEGFYRIYKMNLCEEAALCSI